MAAFPLHKKHEPDRNDNPDERIRVVDLHAPAHARPNIDRRHSAHADHIARLRGETSPGTGISLTLAFLIAGAIILGAITFWSGPDAEAPDGGAESAHEFGPAP